MSTIIQPDGVTTSHFVDPVALAQTSPFGWLAYTSPQWKPHPWLEIVDYYFRCAMDPAHPTKKVALSAPPQHGKSHYSCIGVPSYSVGRFPDKKGLLVLHSSGLAKQFGKQCRDLIKEYGQDVWGIDIDPDTRAKELWSINKRRGGMECVGIKTGIAGKTADWAVFDDPFPGYRESQSATYRDFVWNFYLNDLRPRLSKDAWLVLLQTRWNDDDLIGRIKKGMSDERDEWEFVNLPAIAEETEFYPDGRHFRDAGDPLCPQLKPLEFLESQKNVMELARWLSLYQGQDQQPEGVRWSGEHFGDHVMVDKWPSDIKWAVAYLDPALGRDAKGDDYQAIVYIGVRSGKIKDDMPNDVFYVDADIFRETVDVMCTRSVDFLLSMPRLPIYYFVEGVSFQRTLTKPIIDYMTKLGIKRDVYVEYDEVDTHVEKIMRIMRNLSEYVLRGRFRYVRSRGSALLVNQMRNLGSPASKKDGPDAFSGAMRTFDRLAADIGLSKQRI